MSGLTPRERVRMAIEHKEPDRVPIDFASFRYLLSASGPYGYTALKDYLGLEGGPEPFVMMGIVMNPDPRIQDRLGNDFRTVVMGTPPPEVLGPGHLRVFPFGYFYKSVGPYWYPDFTLSPLKDAQTVQDIENYEFWPDATDPAYVAGARERAKDFHDNTDYAVWAETGMGDAFFHTYHFLRSFEQCFIDMKRKPDLYHALMTKIVDSLLAVTGKFFAEVGPYIDVAGVNGDDLGWQYGPYFSNATYREFIKPYMVKYLKGIRALTDAKFFYHCDGSIFPLIEEFIDMGYDIISPITRNAKDMEPDKLKKRYGQHITFHSGVDVQSVMDRGSIDDVKRHVADTIRTMAPGGGYIFAIEDIKPETPPAHIVAAFDTAMEVGRYPIR